MRALLLWAWLAAGTDARRLAAKKKKVKKKVKKKEKPTCVDATCRTEHDGAYYHKIKCLAELAPVILEAQDGRQRVCADEWLLPALEIFAPGLDAFAGACAACARPAPAAPAAASAALAALQRHAQLPAAKAADVVLVARRDKSHCWSRTCGARRFPAGRRFTKAAQRALVAALKPLGSVRVFYGENETLAETVRLFQDARVVVGYHGAGFANALFQRAAPACAVEIVAAYDDGRPWRTNEELVRFNAGLTWRTVRLGLAEVLAANQNEKRPAEERYPLVKGVRDPDRWLKTVARVDLNATDVARVAAAAAACGGLPRGWEHIPIKVEASEAGEG